jgi:hypothetical protein
VSEWFARSPLASAARVFLAVFLAALVADWTQTGTIAFDKWQTWLIAAVASALPVILRALNPADTAYGRGAKSDEA